MNLTLDEISGYDAANDNFVSGSYLDSGTIIIQIMVLLVNLKIFSSTSTHTCCSFFFQFISVASFFVMFIALAQIPMLS